MSSPDWTQIQVRYESGEVASDIARALGGHPTKQAIYAKAKRDGWQRPNEREATRGSLPVPSSYWEEMDDKQRLVIEAFANGETTIEGAAKRAMVAESTVYRWKHDERFKRLLDCARLATRDKLVSRIMDAGEREWKPNAWLLERLFRDEFAPSHGGIVGNTFNILGRLDLGISREQGMGENRGTVIEGRAEGDSEDHD